MSCFAPVHLLALSRVLIERIGLQNIQYLVNYRPKTGAKGGVDSVAENRLGGRTAAAGRGTVGGRARRHPPVRGHHDAGAVALAQHQEGTTEVGQYEAREGGEGPGGGVPRARVAYLPEHSLYLERGGRERSKTSNVRWLNMREEEGGMYTVGPRNRHHGFTGSLVVSFTAEARMQPSQRYVAEKNTDVPSSPAFRTIRSQAVVERCEASTPAI